MLMVDVFSKPNVFERIDEYEPTDFRRSKAMISETSDSISAIEIPRNSSQPILVASPNYILTNEYIKGRNQLVLIDQNLKGSAVRSSVTEPIIDAIWYDNKQKFFLLTERKIFIYDPNEKIFEPISDMKLNEDKILKSFTVDDQSHALFLAYDEWESKFIDRWQEENDTGRWKLFERHPINLTVNECIGMILAINEDSYFKLAITIYNHLIEQWRMELRDANTFICLKAILLPGSDLMLDYRMIQIKNTTSDIQWLVYSPTRNKIIAVDTQWRKICMRYISCFEKSIH